MLAHPELVNRCDCFFAACADEGWPVGIYSDGRTFAEQFRLWNAYISGERKVEAANPFKIGEKSPWGWSIKGSKHMEQQDGHTHARDLWWGSGVPVGEAHKKARFFGLVFPIPKENWHVEWWLRGAIIPRFDLLPSPPEPFQPPTPRREIPMPYLIIRGDQPGDAWFAVYPTGVVRHVGGSEAQWLVGKNVEVLAELDRPQYHNLVRVSGTAWRPGDWAA